MEAAKTLKAIRRRELRVVAIDITVQDENIAYPTGCSSAARRWSRASAI